LTAKVSFSLISSIISAKSCSLFAWSNLISSQSYPHSSISRYDIFYSILFYYFLFISIVNISLYSIIISVYFSTFFYLINYCFIFSFYFQCIPLLPINNINILLLYVYSHFFEKLHAYTS